MDYIQIQFLNSIQKVFYNIFAIEKFLRNYFDSTGSNSYYELIISNS